MWWLCAHRPVLPAAWLLLRAFVPFFLTGPYFFFAWASHWLRLCLFLIRLQAASALAYFCARVSGLTMATGFSTCRGALHSWHVGRALRNAARFAPGKARVAGFFGAAFGRSRTPGRLRPADGAPPRRPAGRRSPRRRRRSLVGVRFGELGGGVEEHIRAGFARVHEGRFLVAFARGDQRHAAERAFGVRRVGCGAVGGHAVEERASCGLVLVDVLRAVRVLAHQRLGGVEEQPAAVEQVARAGRRRRRFRGLVQLGMLAAIQRYDPV